MKILIVKTSALGDVVHTYPVISYLKTKFPEAQIDWVVEEQSADLVRSHPDINRTLIVKTKTWRKAPFTSKTWQEIKSYRKQVREYPYDLVIDLQGNIKSGFLTMPVKSPVKLGFGWDSVPEKPNLLFTNTRFNLIKGRNIRKDYLFLVQSYFNDFLPFTSKNVALKAQPEHNLAIEELLKNPSLKTQMKVLICPGSAWQNKQMTPDALLTFLKLLQPHLKCSFLLVWGTQNEKELAQKLHEHFTHNSVIVERMPLSALQNLMGKVDYVIAMDSLPLHLAGTTRTPTFSVFGASSADKYQPTGQMNHSLQGPCPYGRTFEKRCPILRTCPTGACIRGLTGEQVFFAFCNKINY